MPGSRVSSLNSQAVTREESVSPIDETDLRGASHITGGIFRGKAAGNHYNFGDFDDYVRGGHDDQPPVHGKVLLYTSRDMDARPIMSISSKTTSQLPSILQELSGRFSPIQKRDSRIYVMQDDMWDIRHQFSKAMEDKSPLEWDMSAEGKYTLSLLAVSVYAINIMLFNL